LRTGAGTRATDDAPLLLDKLTVESAAMLAGENEEAFEELLRLNGSPRTPGPKLWRESARQRKGSFTAAGIAARLRTLDDQVSVFKGRRRT
jgi:hypothetical protein